MSVKYQVALPAEHAANFPEYNDLLVPDRWMADIIAQNFPGSTITEVNSAASPHVGIIHAKATTSTAGGVEDTFPIIKDADLIGFTRLHLTAKYNKKCSWECMFMDMFCRTMFSFFVAT